MIPGLKTHRELNGGAPRGWKHVAPVSVTYEKTAPHDIHVVAIISTWFDGDIVAANVKNCFAQGCDSVYLLDNDSPDDSVKSAVESGAIVGEVYSTKFYDDDLRIQKENEIARKIVEDSSGRTVWILSLDADEFVHGDNGETVKQTLSQIDPIMSCVGSHAFDLYPTGKVQYVVGEHPGKCFDAGSLRIGTFCTQRHWKHVALRYDGVFDIAQTRGNHSPAVMNRHDIVYEPSNISLPILHSPFRRYDDSRARLEALCGKKKDLAGKSRSHGDDQVTGGLGAIKRWQSLEDVYAGRWDRVDIPHCKMLYGRQVTGISLYPWRERFRGIDLPRIENAPE